jgi:hypothetical protein
MNILPGLASWFTRVEGTFGAAAPTWIALYGPRKWIRSCIPQASVASTLLCIAVAAITHDDFDLLGIQGVAKPVFPEVLLWPFDEFRDMFDADNFTGFSYYAMKDGKEIARTAADV